MALSQAKVILLIFGFLATFQLAMQVPAAAVPIQSVSDAFQSPIKVSDSINIPVVLNNDFNSEAILLESDTNSKESSVEKDIKSRAQKLIESIPKEDRAHFIVYYLSEGLNNYSFKPKIQIQLPYGVDIPNQTYLKFKNMTTYEGFSRDLLLWTQNILGTNNIGIHKFVVTKTACPPWGCFDPNDVGELCCPF